MPDNAVPAATLPDLLTVIDTHPRQISVPKNITVSTSLDPKV